MSLDRINKQNTRIPQPTKVTLQDRLEKQKSPEVNFRNQALDAGLITQDYPLEAPSFNLDLNSGEINLTNPTPERLYELVKLARKNSEHASYGEHNAILGLATFRDKLADFNNGKYISWLRTYSFSRETEENMITAKQYLKEKGFDLSDKALLS